MRTLDDLIQATVDELRANCHMTFNGGHDGEKCEAFHHGMDTVCNVLRGGTLRAALSEAVAQERKALREDIANRRPPDQVLEPRDHTDRYWLGWDDALAEELAWLDAREEHPREGKPAQEGK